MNNFFSDLKQAFRSIRKHPGFTAIIILILACGTGANTAIFATLYTVLIQPLPYPNGDALVQLWEIDSRSMSEAKMTSVSNLVDWRQRNRTLQGIAASQRPASITITNQTPGLELNASVVSANFFSVLNIAPALGRVFLPEEEQRITNVVVISHSFWRSYFGERQDAIGARLQLDQENYQVIGVMPQNFRSPVGDADLWIPLSIQPGPYDRGQNYLQTFARLKDEVTIEQAQSDLDSIAKTLAREYPTSNAKTGIMIIQMQKQLTSSIRTPLTILSIVVFLVLLVCCSNVSNLLTIRAFDRNYEYAVRTILGASRWQIIRQMLMENVLLFLAAGISGLILAKRIIRIFIYLEPQLIPSIASVEIGLQSFIYTFSITTVTGILFGMIPAFQLKIHQSEGLTRQGKTIQQSIGESIRQFLTISQVALSVILVSSAVLLIQSFLRLRRVEPGFSQQNVVVARQAIDGPEYTTPPEKSAYYDRLMDRLKEIPNVQQAGAATVIPMGNFGIDFEVPYARETDPPVDRALASQAAFRAITPEYFETLHIRLLQGRQFTNSDTSSSPLVVIINEKLAAQLWPNESAVGKRLRFFWADWQTYNVIGVVANTFSYGFLSKPVPELFVSHNQIPYSVMNVLVRFRSITNDSLSEVRKTFLQVDPLQPLQHATTLEQLCDESIQRERFVATLTMSFALLGILLALAGIYGTLSFDAIRRTREIGLRMALGATRAEIRNWILIKGANLLIAGIVAGLAGSLGTSLWLQKFLFGKPSGEWITFGMIAVSLLIAGTAACLIPANRASSLDPNAALRRE